MKRTIAIILVVILFNVLIFWITSFDSADEELKPTLVAPPLDLVESPPPVEETRSLLLPADAVDALKKPREVDPKKIFSEMAVLWKNAARQTLPYLVVVEARRGTEDGETALSGNAEGAPLWHARKNITRSAGIVLDDGYSILTTFDLISGASELKIQTLSGEILQARPVAADLVTRLALIQVSKKLPSDIRWGLAVEAGLADAVMTLYMDQQGDPRCILASITGLGYSPNTIFPGTVKSYLSLDLDDTQMMPGALVINIEGQAIGMINSIGQAVMTEQVLFVADSLIRLGEVRRAWLGIQFQPLTAKLAPHFGLEASGGFLVTAVAPESPASRADLRTGDVITRIQGQVIRNQGLFSAAISEVTPGSSINLTVLRAGEAIEMTVQLGLLVQEPASTVRWDDHEPVEDTTALVETVDEVAESDVGNEARPEVEERELDQTWTLVDALRVTDSEEGLILEGINLERAVLSDILDSKAILLSINRQPVRSIEEFTALKAELVDEESLLLEVTIKERARNTVRYLIVEETPLK